MTCCKCCSERERHVLTIRQIKYIIKFLTQQLLNELWMALSLCVDACSGGGRVVGLTKPRYAGLKSLLTVNISRLVKISNKPWSTTIQTVSPPGCRVENIAGESASQMQTADSQLRGECSTLICLLLSPGRGLVISAYQASPSSWLGSAVQWWHIMYLLAPLWETSHYNVHPGILTYLVV